MIGKDPLLCLLTCQPYHFDPEEYERSKMNQKRESGSSLLYEDLSMQRSSPYTPPWFVLQSAPSLLQRWWVSRPLKSHIVDLWPIPCTLLRCSLLFLWGTRSHSKLLHPIPCQRAPYQFQRDRGFPVILHQTVVDTLYLGPYYTYYHNALWMFVEYFD